MSGRQTKRLRRFLKKVRAGGYSPPSERTLRHRFLALSHQERGQMSSVWVQHGGYR